MCTTEENAESHLTSLCIKMECFSHSSSQISRNRGRRGGAIRAQSSRSHSSQQQLHYQVKELKQERRGKKNGNFWERLFLFFFFFVTVRLLKMVHFLKTNYPIYFNYSTIFQVPLPGKGSLFLPLKRFNCFIFLKTSITWMPISWDLKRRFLETF